MENSIHNYDAVLQDLLNQRAELDRMIENIQQAKRLAEMRRGLYRPSEPNGLNTNPEHNGAIGGSRDESISRPYAPRAPRSGEITLVAGAEKILREAGSPMHVNDIVAKLATLGKITTLRSLNSTLIQDPQKRFINYGQNVFGLADRPADSQTTLLSVPSASSPRAGLSIGDAIEKALRDAGHKLTVSEIIDAAAKLGITASSNSIRSTLSQDSRFARVDQGVYALDVAVKSPQRLYGGEPQSDKTASD
jgi:HB1, ASXL, restriction endonuclease HTH domain